MQDQSSIQNLARSVQRYFDLMYDSDVSRFDRVFRSSAQLHGFREGAMVMWTANEFRDLIGARPSPKSLDAPRREEVLLIDFASPTQALAKVRVRINTATFVDYLTFHLIDGEWLITSKAFHLEAAAPRT
jgi:hypothetical protein